MSQLDILLPFGLPPEELAADLFRELKVPALANLVARAQSARQSSRHEVFDEFSRALPHETWIARQFGLEGRDGASPPVAGALMREFGLPPQPGAWFVVHPVHFHVARDHIVLSDPRQLPLSDAEARALFDAAQPLFEEAGKTLSYGNAATWFARADDWHALQTSTPDATSGHNIDIWMPKGEGDRNWRRLQNEVQMHWYTHPVNAEREARDIKPVNSIWLWGGTPGGPPAGADQAASSYTDAYHLSGWMQAMGQLVPRQSRHATVSDITGARPERGLLLLDALLEPALASDWSQWLAQMHMLDAEWFAPLLAALKSGKLERISLIATHHSRVSTYSATAHSLRKFWVKPSLAPLVP
jgi:hypothetical protein